MVFLDTDFLESNEIKLLLEKTTEADPVKNYVPAYHFLICDRQGTVMGHCALRIGYNDSLYYVGDIVFMRNTEEIIMLQKPANCSFCWRKSMV